MLQVARLAPRQLGESRDLVAAFLRAQLNDDGAFQDRAGTSDLYYTVFGLDALIALQEPLPADTAAYLTARTQIDALDFVHLCCLARAWAALRQAPPNGVTDRILDLIEACRSADGGYATVPNARHGSAYAAFLAVGAYEDLGADIRDRANLLASLEGLRAADGSYGNVPGVPSGLTTTTAAAVVLRHHFGEASDRQAGVWLLDRCHQRGGFFASTSAPIPDLLSTATALHALAALQLPVAGLRECCLDFLDSLWTSRGGFFGTWADTAVDVEYTYYALLALGHLSLEPA